MHQHKRICIRATAIILLAGSIIFPRYSISADPAAETGLAESQLETQNIQEQKATLISDMSDIESQIVMSQTALSVTTDAMRTAKKELKIIDKNLEDLEEQKAIQEEAMARRIQYIYEVNQGAGELERLLSWENIIGDDKKTETQELMEYDRKCLGEYEELIQKEAQLQKQKRAVLTTLTETKQTQEEALAGLETLLEKAKAEIDGFDDRIKELSKIAEEYKRIIKEEQEWIAAVEEENRRAAEAAAIEAAAQTNDYQEVYYQEEASSVEPEYTEEPPLVTAIPTTPEVPEVSVISEEKPDEKTVTKETKSDNESSGVGQEIVDFALQYVGNPYVWGGNNLDTGVDCSGFVQQVFKNFDVDVSRTTYTQINDGVEVKYEDMQPGDVINYGYHTAIYMGDNQIVHAANEDLGIIVQDDPAYEPIVGIRRFTDN